MINGIKHLLRSYVTNSQRLQGLLLARALIKQHQTKIDPTESVSAKKNPTSPTERAVLELDKIEQDIADACTSLYVSQYRVTELIEMVDDDTLKTLLTLRYINGKRWEKIADEMHYSYRHILKLHEKALEILCEKFKDDTQ